MDNTQMVLKGEEYLPNKYIKITIQIFQEVQTFGQGDKEQKYINGY